MLKKYKRVCEGKLTQNQIMDLKGIDFSYVEIASPVSLGGGPKEQSSPDILFGADQASVNDILQYLGNDMSQVNLLTCLNLQVRGLLTAGYIIVSYSSLGD